MWYLIVSIPDLCTLTYFKHPKCGNKHLFSTLTIAFDVFFICQQPYRLVESHTPRSTAALPSTIPVASKIAKLFYPRGYVNDVKLFPTYCRFFVEIQSGVTLQKQKYVTIGRKPKSVRFLLSFSIIIPPANFVCRG